MARLSLPTGFLAVAAVLIAVPAAAQFGSIFSDSPPRPPVEVPRGRPSDAREPYYPSQRQPEPYYPSQSDQRQAPRPQYNAQAPRPPVDIHSNTPPAEPLPAPMSLPPSSRPGGGTIQSQDLAPPPGTEPSAAPLRPQQPVQQQQPQQQQQQQQPGDAGTVSGAQQPVDTSVRPGDEIVVEPPPQRIANPTAVFAGLDKITGRIISFDVAINETVQFGALQVTPRMCYSRPPTETPNTDSFVEVDEVTLQGEIKRIFTGWMFAASPGLHAVEHPIYDVWLTDCKGAKNPAVAEAPETSVPKPQQPPQRRTTPRQQPRAQQRPGFVR